MSFVFTPGPSWDVTQNNAGSTRQTAAKQAMGRAKAEKPVPMVLQVSTNRIGADLVFGEVAASVTSLIAWPCGLWSQTTDLKAGYNLGNILAAIEVIYGAGGVTRHCWFDVKPGSYQLPPCDDVQVFVRWYLNGFSSGFNYPFTLNTHIEAGITTSPTRPTVTGLRSTNSTGYSSVYNAFHVVPPQARWVDVTNSGPAGPFVIYGVTEMCAPYIVRDFTAGAEEFFPPWSPVEIQGSSYNFVSAPANTAFSVQYYLEL